MVKEIYIAGGGGRSARTEVANRKRREDTIEELSGRKQSLSFDKMRSEYGDWKGNGGRFVCL